MPPVQRYQPAWKQIADHFKQEILEGRLAEGDRLPPVRQVAGEWGVSQGTAQQAYVHLHLAERLVRTDASGTYADAPRASLSPQQRMRLAAAPAAEVVTVTAAGLVPAPPYVQPMFGLSATAMIIRREEVTRLAGGSAGRLSVTWLHPGHATAVPELLHAAPLPDPRGAAHLIAVREGTSPAALTGGIAFECRAAKDDGREMPALGLGPGAFVLAGVSGWRHGDDLLEYTEFVLPPGRVIEADIDPV